MDQISEHQRAMAEGFGHGGDVAAPNPAVTNPRLSEQGGGYQAPAAQSSPGLSGTLLPPRPRITEAEARALRRREREAGVEFWLKDTGIAARVRDLPFADRMILEGIPADMRKAIEQLLLEARGTRTSTLDIAATLRLIDGESALTDGVCIAGFLWPRLVRTEAERSALVASGEVAVADVWLVDSLSAHEKEGYRTFVFRSREGAKEDAARLASFPDAGVAQAPGRETR